MKRENETDRISADEKDFIRNKSFLMFSQFQYENSDIPMNNERYIYIYTYVSVYPCQSICISKQYIYIYHLNDICMQIGCVPSK